MNPIKLIYKSNSWNDLTEKLSKLEFNSRGDVFEWFCVFYLQIEPRYKVSYKRILHSKQFLKDNKIKKNLGFIHNEEGVDAIAERYDGKYEIIQCKYINNVSKNLNKGHIESSLEVAEGKVARNFVDTILMCSNAKGITQNKALRNRHPNIQIRTMMGGDFQGLSKLDFDNIRKVIDNQIPTYLSLKPRPHQKLALKKITSHFAKNDRGQLIHACGTGKTLTSYLAYKEMSPSLALYVVPSLQLINQTLSEWCKESLSYKQQISPFVICSDKSNEKVGESEPELWLQELGIKVSNKIDDLNVFINSTRKNKVIFSTYQSGPIIAKHLKTLEQVVDLALFDEAHNTATHKSKLFGHLLIDKNILIKKRLFMTATPKKLSRKNKDVFSMDSDSHGKIIDQITVKDAIESLKVLNDYKIITQNITNKDIQALLKDNPFVVDKKKLPEENELKLIAAGLTLDKAISAKGIQSTISFHSRVNRAKAFQAGLHKITTNNITTFHVNGKQSGAIRQNILKEFSDSPPSLVTNAQCLSEGVNVPSIDAVMFVDPKQSKIDITQAIGRALRKGKGAKGDSFIIVPIVIDKDKPDSINESYQQIFMVLRSMAEHDGRIVEYFKLIAQGKKPPKKFLELDQEHLPVNFDFDSFNKALHLKAWNKVSQLGWMPFDQFKTWFRTLGINSSQWRAFSKSDKKPIDVPSQPDIVYKEWTNWRDVQGINSVEDDFSEFINRYKLYAKQNKKMPIPPDVCLDKKDGYDLGMKIRALMLSYKDGILPKWKLKIVKEELIKPGIFIWEGRDVYSWHQFFNAWKAYYEKTGKGSPPKGTISNDYKIEGWVQQQKKKYVVMKGIEKFDNKKYKIKPLLEWQYKILLKGKFIFENENDIKWKNNYAEFKPTIEKFKGHVPNNKHNKLKLTVSTWVRKNKERYQKGTLEEDRVALLEKIKYWTW
tara:strand:+ start:144 stop:2966 length:2823 start_codon:yes stop_codon:yes gene_type:complete